MSTLRKEPVIDSDAFDLIDRVKLTWREVRNLEEKQNLQLPQEENQTTQLLSQEELDKIIHNLTEEIENSLRKAISDTLEISLQNASSRVRSDLDRSLNRLIKESVSINLRTLSNNNGNEKRSDN